MQVFQNLGGVRLGNHLMTSHSLMFVTSQSVWIRRTELKNFRTRKTHSTQKRDWMLIKVQAKNLNLTRNLLNGIVKDLDEDVSALLHKLGEDIVAEAKSNLQNNTNINSGTLLSSIRILFEDNKTIDVGTDIDYAGYIEYGRGPIKPIKGKYLHWVDKNTGKDVFATFANATEPAPFLEPAVIVKTKKFGDIFIEKQEKKAEDLIT